MAATLSSLPARLAGLVLACLLLALNTAALSREPGGAAGDPTRPPSHLLESAAPASPGARAGAADARTIILQAILHAEGRPPKVMIEGWLYRIGDTVHGCRLTAIGRQSADCEAKGRRVKIALIPDARITRAGNAEADAQPAPPLPLIKPLRARQSRPNKEDP